LIAAPYAGRLFAEFGADVIKVERPGTGDELRRWRLYQGNTSLFWSLQARNKKSITLDLRAPEGQDIVLTLLPNVDVVLENFRPGTLEKWNLGYEQMKAVNPDIIFVRISGYGQTGPYRDRPGFGGIAEAMGGLRHLTGYPDRPPTRLGVSLGDSLAGMFGAIGALMALLYRERERGKSPKASSEGYGQEVDVALYESVFAITESLLPEYDGYGIIRQRTGNILPGLTPSNIYPCQDNRSLSPTHFRSGGKTAIAGGGAATASIGAKRRRSLPVRYRANTADPDAACPYHVDHADHSGHAVPDARRRPLDASTTRRPETTPVTGDSADPGAAHDWTPTASHAASCLEKWTPPACASDSAARVYARQADH